MANLVDKFGSLVNKQVAAGNPKGALRLLKIAYAAYEQVQKYAPSKTLIPSRRKIAVSSMEYVRHPLSHPERAAIVNIFMPPQIMHAMGIETQVAEGLSCYITGTSSQASFLEQAARAGAPDTLCSYHRILTGMAMSDTLPRPRFIANTTLACDGNMVTFRLLAQHYGLPHFTVDVPYSQGPTETAYVADQLRDLVAFIEDVMGEKLDEARLRESIESSNRALASYRRYLEILPGIVLKNDQTSESYTILATHLMLGSKPAEDYFAQLLKDAEGAVRTEDLPPKKRPRRIFWAHTIPYYQKPVRDFFAAREDGSFANQLLCCDMTTDAIDDLDPNRPYESMAERLLANAFNGDAERRCGRVIDYAKRLNAEGIVYFCHWGCRNTSGATRLMTDLADEAGIPLLILDGDGCDPSNTSDGQVLTRLEAFAELIDATREAKR